MPSSSIRLGEGAHGHRAAPTKGGENGTLGAQGPLARFVVDGSEETPGALVIRSALHGDGALARLGQHVDGVEHIAEPVRPTEAVESGDRHHDGRDVPFVDNGHTPRHVAA